MFRKDKKPASTFTATVSDDTLDALAENKALHEEIAHLRGGIGYVKTSTGAITDPLFETKYNLAANTLGYSPYYGYSEGHTTSPDHIRMLEEIHAAVCTHLNFAESIAELTDVLDSMECPTNECKSCKYYRPGGVDFCNTSLRIAEYLVLNGIVNVFHVPGLDKTE